MADELELASLTLYQILVIWSSYVFYVGIHTLGVPYAPAWLPAISAYHADAAIALVALGRGFLPEYPPAWIPTMGTPVNSTTRHQHVSSTILQRKDNYTLTVT